MKLRELFESPENLANKMVVILAGRFQPPHPGHLHGYLSLVEKFGAHNVYITMTDKTNPETAPFSYDERKEIFTKLLGIPSDRIIKVSRQYNVEELSKTMNFSDDTAVVFAISEKDASENRFSIGRKQDGSETYMQKYNEDMVVPYLTHSYVIEYPTTEFSFNKFPLNSASQLRDLFRKFPIEKQKKLFTEMYGKFDERIFKVFLDKFN